ncbi:2OG-Fe(II) oxygenase family protein [Scytonema sp. NUACC26]|uniref:2OG-Fe(II) oxygenase family protein n=1 Tax=Scytonema sp. NUACC26 TaxID=3140176 RepID=UPI0034DB90E1
MLNLSAIRTATMQEFPYRHTFIEKLLSEETSAELAKSFPQHEFRESTGNDHCFLWRRLIANDEDIAKMQQLSDHWLRRIESKEVTSDIDNLSPIWQKLIVELWQPEYIETMEELSGLQLSNCVKVIALRQYHPGHYILPHTDQPSKILTHLLFLNEHWSSAWGGCLQILHSQQPESIYQEILPLSACSVVFVRADNSWHMVNTVTQEAPSCRLAAQIAFFSL